MKNKVYIIFTLIILFIVNILPESFAKDYSAKVLSNHDGDTITVSVNGKKEKVRLLGIDTAEIAQGTWGTKAKEFTQKLTKGKQVKLETDIQERDKYGRLLAYVYVDGKSVNLELIKQGYAQLLTYAPNVKYVDEFKTAQTQARNSHKGIWGTDGLKQSPYEFRHGSKKSSSTYNLNNKTISKSKKNISANSAVLVHVNRKSGIYHYSGCRYYDCKNCTIELTASQAEAQGYRHCKVEG